MGFLSSVNLIHWIQTHEEWLTLLGIISLIMFLGSLAVIPYIIIRLPKDYFVSSHDHWLRNHPAFLPVFIIQHVLGFILVVAGILMLVLPGQGILSILIGLSLISFPGKYQLLHRVFRWKKVNQSMNWIRRKAGVESLQIPDELPD